MIMLVMAFLFAVSTASAGDVNDTAVTSVDMELMESQNIEIDGDNLQASEETSAAVQANDDENLSVKLDSQILGAGEGNYSDLRNDIANGGSLTKSVYYYLNGDGGTIEIKNTMTVDGKGAVIDMKGSNIRAFYVSGSNVTIKNLTIKNAFYDGQDQQHCNRRLGLWRCTLL